MRGDPQWIFTRWSGRCRACSARIPRGSRAWWWPSCREVECERCGAESAARFECEAFDESVSVWS